MLIKFLQFTIKQVNNKLKQSECFNIKNYNSHFRKRLEFHLRHKKIKLINIKNLKIPFLPITNIRNSIQNLYN